MSETPRIFVSHSHEDDDFCRKLIADLRARLGDDAVWYDTSGGLHGSDDWWDRIIAEITERPYFLVVLSPNASASKWVPEEMKIAYRQHVMLGKVLLPVRLADAPRRADWEGTQEFDFTLWQDTSQYAAAFGEVLRALSLDMAESPRTTNAQAAISSSSLTRQDLSATARLAQETHTAYGREHWSDVLDKTDILIERHAMTPQLWRERASASTTLRGVKSGVAVAEEVLRANPDDADTLLLSAQLLASAGDDTRAVAAYTRAYALSPLDDTTERLSILDGLVPALVRLKRWDEFRVRVGDALRMAPGNSVWQVRFVEGMLLAEQWEEAIRAAEALPPGTDLRSTEEAWQGAVAETTRRGDWAVRRSLLRTATAAGVNARAIMGWRRSFPHYVVMRDFAGHRGSVTCVAWAPDGVRLASASIDKSAIVWEQEHGRLVATLAGHDDRVRAVAWSPDGRHAATACDDTKVRVWNVERGHLEAVLAGHHSPVLSVAWSPDGSCIASVVDNGYATLWDTQSMTVRATLKAHDSAVTGVAWAPSGQRFATASTDNTAKIWDVASGKALTELTGHSGYVWAVAWSPNGASVATASYDHSACIWNANTGQLVASLAGHSDALWGIAWAHDGARIATASNDGTACIWDVASAQKVCTLVGHATGVYSVAWAPDDSCLATGSADKTTKTWVGE